MSGSVTLEKQVGSTRAWAKTHLWAQVLIGLVAGVITGIILGPDLALVDPEAAETIGRWLAIPGRLFLSLISLVLVPLVFVSIVQGIAGTGGGKTLRRLGTRLLVFVVLTTTFAASLGIVIARLLRPGAFMAGDEAQTDVPIVSVPAGPSAEEATRERILDRLPDIITDLVPGNPSQVFLERDLFAVVVLATLTGIAITAAKASSVRTLLDALGGLLEISMTVVKWAMFLAPYAVFGLIAQMLVQVGVATLLGLAMYAACILLGLAVLYVAFLGIVAVFARRDPMGFAREIAPVQLMAFSTSSTAAVMPLSIDTAMHKLDVNEHTASLVIPLAATINMAGTALYQTVAILFLAQAAGIGLGPAATVGIVGSVVAASIGAPGTPGVGVVILSSIAAGAGIPPVGLPLVLGLDRPLDMCRTTVNVTGDLTACVVVDRGVEGEVSD